MAEVKYAVEVSAVSYKDSNGNTNQFKIKSNNIISFDLNEGISIPFIAKIVFLSSEKLFRKDLKALLNQELTLKISQSSNELRKSRFRELKGIITNYVDHGRCFLSTKDGKKEEEFCYELGVCADIQRLAYKIDTKELTGESTLSVIQKVLSENSLSAVGVNNNLFGENEASFKNVIFSQHDESDYDFLSRIINAYGINYNIVYDREGKNNKYLFSRSWATDNGNKVFDVGFGESETPKALDNNIKEVTLSSEKGSFFDAYSVEDISSDGSVDEVIYGNSTKQYDNIVKNNSSYFQTKSTTDTETQNTINLCYSDSVSALYKNVSSKNLVKAYNLAYAPGCSINFKDDSDNYLIIRNAISIKLKDLEESLTSKIFHDTSIGVYDFYQTFVCLSYENADGILGCVEDYSRVFIDTSISECGLIRNIEPTAATQEQNVVIAAAVPAKANQDKIENSISFVSGVVCDEALKTEKSNNIAPASTSNSLLPTQFYLKVNEKRITVEYVNQTGNPSDYLAHFPRVGQRVKALEYNGSYIFYSYEPDRTVITNFDSSLRDANMSISGITKYSKDKEVINYDMGVEGVYMKSFDSYTTMFCDLILNQKIDSFLLASTIICNNYSIYEKYVDEKTTVALSSGTTTPLKKATEAIAKDIKSIRESLQTSPTKSSDMTKAYEDLKKIANAIMELYGTTVVDKSGKKTTVSVVESDKLFDLSKLAMISKGDINIQSDKNIVLDAKNITLNASSGINIRCDGQINILSEKGISENCACSSFSMSPRSVDIGVKRVWVTDLPYDSTVSLSNDSVSIQGLKTDMTAFASASMSEAMGAKAEVKMGTASVTGAPVKLTNQSKDDIKSSIIDFGFDMTKLLNIWSAYAKNSKNAVTILKKVPKDIYKLSKTISKFEKDRSKYSDKDMDKFQFVTNNISNAIDMLTTAYDLAETIALANIDKDQDKAYKTRNRANCYMSPQDCVKHSMSYAKTIAALVPKIAALRAAYLGGKTSTLSVAPKSVKMESPEFTNNSIKNTFANVALSGTEIKVVKKPEAPLSDGYYLGQTAVYLAGVSAGAAALANEYGKSLNKK